MIAMAFKPTPKHPWRHHPSVILFGGARFQVLRERLTTKDARESIQFWADVHLSVSEADRVNNLLNRLAMAPWIDGEKIVTEAADV